MYSYLDQLFFFWHSDVFHNPTNLFEWHFVIEERVMQWLNSVIPRVFIYFSYYKPLYSMKLPLAWWELPAESDFFTLIPGHRGFRLKGQDYKAAFAMAHRNHLGESRQSCDWDFQKYAAPINSMGFGSLNPIESPSSGLAAVIKKQTYLSVQEHYLADRTCFNKLVKIKAKLCWGRINKNLSRRN